ncbi:hypothetical protein [Lacipirellula parvula]|uniref:hypothetical protein n=1 Tax=Lacipirellula parvula TaxID=2650471 RepID=UPI001562207A|nr:hypothetical protein [Lacipirellula parvula]
MALISASLAERFITTIIGMSSNTWFFCFLNASPLVHPGGNFELATPFFTPPTKKAPGVLGRPGLRLVWCLAMIRLRTTSGHDARSKKERVGKAKPEVVQIRGHHGCIVGRRSGSSKRFFAGIFSMKTERLVPAATPR